MAKSDWLDDILDVAKNSEDLRAIGEAPSLREKLAIHERMKQRQRERDYHAALQKANELAERDAERQDQFRRKQNRLLQEQQEAEQAERLRVAALPKCPECQSPVEGNQPRRCANCGSELFWFLKEPVDRHGIPPKLIEAVRARLVMLLESLRSAAVSFARTATRTKAEARLAAVDYYETRLNQWAVRACQDEAAARLRLRDVNREQGKLHGPRKRAEAAVQSGPNERGCATVLVGALVICALFFFSLAQSDGPVPAKIGAYCFVAACIFTCAVIVYRASRAPAESERQLATVLADIAALSHKEDEEKRALDRFSVSCCGVELTPCVIGQSTVFVQSAVGMHGPAAVGQALSELFRKVPATCRFADTEIEAEQFIDEAIAAAAIANAKAFALELGRDCESLAEGEALLPEDVRDDLAIVRTVVGRVSPDAMQLSRDTAAITVLPLSVRPLPPCLADTAGPSSSSEEHRREPHAADAAGAALLDALCCVAVGDRSINQQEVDRIVEALTELGVQLSKPRLQAVVVDACKRIHAKGTKAYAGALCRHLLTTGNAGLCALVIEWQKKVVEADGRSAESEKEIMQMFEEQLKTQSDCAGAPRYSDLDVAQTPPNL